MYTIFDAPNFGVPSDLKVIVPLARKYGIGGVGVPTELMDDPKNALEMAKLVFDNGLKWSLLPTFPDFFTETVPEDVFDEKVEEFKRWAELGEKMGVRYCYNHVWSGSNFREPEAQYEWVLRRLRRLWRVADEHGMKYGMEFLGPVPLQKSFKYPFFNNIAGILSLADEVSPKCGFLFDTYHWYCGSNQNPGDLYLAAAHVDRMVNFHLNDGYPDRTREQQEDLERHLPLTTGVIDAATPYRLFEERGYTGPVMCEPIGEWRKNTAGLSIEESIAAVAAAYERVRLAAAAKK